MTDETGKSVPGPLDAIRWARDTVIPKPSRKVSERSRTSIASPSYKAMLMVLASRANESLAVWTSPRTLGENTQMADQRNVRRMVEDLVDLGLMMSAPTRRIPSGSDGVNVYVLNAHGWLDDVHGDTAALIARLRFLEEATQIANTPLRCEFKQLPTRATPGPVGKPAGPRHVHGSIGAFRHPTGGGPVGPPGGGPVGPPGGGPVGPPGGGPVGPPVELPLSKGPDGTDPMKFRQSARYADRIAPGLLRTPAPVPRTTYRNVCVLTQLLSVTNKGDHYARARGERCTCRTGFGFGINAVSKWSLR